MRRNEALLQEFSRLRAQTKEQREQFEKQMAQAREAEKAAAAERLAIKRKGQRGTDAGREKPTNPGAMLDDSAPPAAKHKAGHH